VSAPLRWDEVAPGLDPARFTTRSMAARIARVGDPLQGLLEEQPDVRAAVSRLEALTRRGRAA
jgi:bifunctional non-homologous end joining protein LigD